MSRVAVRGPDEGGGTPHLPPHAGGGRVPLRKFFFGSVRVSTEKAGWGKHPIEFLRKSGAGSDPPGREKAGKEKVDPLDPMA